jgi:hypothetical protein
MSRSKEWFMEKTLGEFENLDLHEQTSFLEVFTNVEAKPKGVESNFHFKIFGRHEYLGEFLVKEESGVVPACGCSDCKSMGADWYEFYSATQALTWIDNLDVHLPITLWMTSDKLILEDAENVFGGRKIKCKHLQNLHSTLLYLFHHLSIDVNAYTYANKDIIRVWFH